MDHDVQVEDTTTQALVHAFFMIIVSEIGDKTFLIAAILAMRHPRAVVFAGAFGSLIVMSILSAEMGHILPSLIPKQWTQFAAAVLFLVFGVKMAIEGRGMQSGAGPIQDEMKEVEEELELEEAKMDGTGGRMQNGTVVPLEEIEEGGRSHSNSESQTPPSMLQGAKNLLHLCFGPAFVQAFVLTFLGEWGDRSQIATIALGANHVRRLHTPVFFTQLSLECLLGIVGYSNRTRCMHNASRFRRSLSIHQDLRQARSVIPRSTPPKADCCGNSHPGRLRPLSRVRHSLFPRSMDFCRLACRSYPPS
jgi:putative Ca2+/H+ antiporter (TMEM165/GDT1 family)